MDQYQATSSSDLRRANIGRLLRSVHTNGPTSRAELAREMGLARSTIGSLVEELVTRGLISEGPAREGNARGRPSPVVGAHPQGPVVLALDISTDSLAAAVVGLGGVVFGETRVERERGAQDPVEIVEGLHALGAPLIDEVGVSRIISIGVSTPGSVREGFVHSAVNLGWRSVPLDAIVAERFGLEVPVAVGNDSNMATLAEHVRGVGVGVRDLVVLWGEEGIGAGIMTGGRPLTGAEGYAGRVGHWPLSTEGIACRCGSRRCWETVVGEDALLRRLGRAGATKRAALDRAFAILDEGGPKAQDAIRSIGGWLGIGIAALAETFNPSVIALSGFLGRLFPYLRDAIAAELHEPALSPPRESVRVVPSGLGGDAALLGAAEQAFAPMLADPTAYRRRRRRSSTTFLSAPRRATRQPAAAWASR